MLRVMLGVCGAGLVALGVFGGKMLEDTYQSVAQIFEPGVESSSAVVVAAQDEAVSKPQTQMIVAEPAKPATTEPLVVAEISKPEKPRILEIAAEKLTEVKASAKQDGAVIKTVATGSTALVQPILPKEVAVDEAVKATTGSAPSNTLYVMKDRVNLREGPSINHPIVLQLEAGQELMEFKRDGKWVHVGAYGTSGKIGWVHGTLVSEN